MASTRHLTLNISYPVSSFAPSYTGDGMALVIVCTATTSSAAQTMIAGGTTSTPCMIATAASGSNDYTILSTVSSATTIYAAIGVARPYSSYYHPSTALTLTVTSNPSLSVTYPITQTAAIRTYITSGRLSEAESNTELAYDFNELWAKWESRPYGGRDVIDADTVNGGTNFRTTRSGKCLVASKHIYMNPDSTLWNTQVTVGTEPPSNCLTRGQYYSITRTSHSVTIMNSTSSALSIQATWTISPGFQFNYHGTVQNGTTNVSTSENTGELNTAYLCRSASMSFGITSLFGGTVKLTCYFGNFYFTGNLTQTAAVLRLSPTTISDTSFGTITLQLSKG